MNATNTPINTDTKSNTTITAIDVQGEEEIFVVAEDEEVALTEEDIGSLFQGTSSKDELGNK